ncbi:hypothetical protein Daus18300_002346 [Diaporthe australafricana]|uniref:Rhodopsin domain-containing protein n=1 Tax=Diaporthe australafricana TaxID=127596 RepID=A0ABR3XR40_9PEZI
MVKLSILLFYWKVFAINNGNTFNKRIMQVTTVACIVWLIVVTFVLVFQCSPIPTYWDKFVQAPYCMNAAKTLLGYEMTNLFLDVAILCIPLPIVWQLNLQMSKRMGLVGVFFLGGL